MKKSLLIFALLALAVTAFAEYVPLELPKIDQKVVDALANADKSPVAVRLSDDGTKLIMVDVLAVGETIANREVAEVPAGFHPIAWWKANVQPVAYLKRHWKGALITAGTAAVAGVTYAIVEHNDGGGGSSKAAAEDEEAVPEIEIPTNQGDQTYIAIEGDYNAVTIYNSSPLGMAAIPE